MTSQPWASGPAEILGHGLSLLGEDSDRNRRLAMILIDNSVELMIKTYLGLPRRVTGLALSRKAYGEMSESFPKLLDAVEEHAPDKLDGINLGEIEWYHRLRNELYHQGNGLTVERAKVEVYAELSRLLFRNLFGVDVDVEEEGQPDSHERLGKFLALWVQVERTLGTILNAVHEGGCIDGSRHAPVLASIREISRSGYVKRETANSLVRVRALRNSVVHGQQDHDRVLTPALIRELEELLSELRSAAASLGSPGSPDSQSGRAT